MTLPKPRLLCMVNLDAVPEVRAVLEPAFDTTYHHPDHAALVRLIEPFDALWVNFDVQADRAVLDRAPRLKVVATATTGTDHLDKTECARRGIRILCIASDYGLLRSFTATAECAWMLILACSRHFRQAADAALAGDWSGSAHLPGRQLSGKTLGVLGVGRLGSMTVEYGKAFRMRVLGCDVKPFEIPGVTPVNFDTLLHESDVLSIHIHLTPETRHLFNAATFRKLKRGAILINTSRGDLLDETSLLAALEDGTLAAFGADVLHDEWRRDMAAQPVMRYAQTHPNVVLTPHIGGNTRESVTMARLFMARKLAHFIRTGDELTMP